MSEPDPSDKVEPKFENVIQELFLVYEQGFNKLACLEANEQKRLQLDYDHMLNSNDIQ